MNKNLKKIASALILAAAVSGGAQAQLSNTLYFQRNNFRSNQVNPAFKPEGKFYMSSVLLPIPVSGFVAVAGGNNSLSFGDVIKNVNNKTVFVLDKAVPNGQQQFLDALRNTMSLDMSSKATIIDFGFRAGEKNFITFSVNANAEAHSFVPKQFFNLVLDGINYREKFDLDIKKLGANALAYVDVALGFTRDVNENLSLGGKLKFLKGTAMKADFSDLDVTASADEWNMSGSFDIYAPLFNRELVNENGHFSEIQKNEDDIDFATVNKNLGMGMALDLGVKYNLNEKLHLSASVIDLGFVGTKNASNIHMQKDFSFSGFDYDINTQELNTDIFEDEFKESVVGYNGEKFKQMLTTKVYLGAEYDLNRAISVGALSKTSFLGNHVWEDLNLSLNLHPVRLISWSLAYNIYDHQWSSLSTGLTLNLGPLGLFAAVDNIPFQMAKIDDVKIPLNTKFARVNLGMGWTFGAGNKKNKDLEPLDEEEAEPDFLDADGDGVENLKDRCAGTPAGVEVDEHGCPLDADKDGVPDYLDKCADTPEGVTVDENGCPVDTDNDGVADYLDKCPDTPEGMPVDENGCPIDEDGDGVTDALDKCPGTPAGVKVTAEGCPVDTDGDGIPDYLDKCPEVPGVAANNGCPEVKKEVLQLFKKALNGIQFQTGKATILRASYPILDQIAATMKANPTYKLNISGHTDNVGNAASNLQLSKDRANSVMQYLLGKGIEAERLNAEGFGDTQPVVPNTSSANRAKNRRVEFEVEFLAPAEAE